MQNQINVQFPGNKKVDALMDGIVIRTDQKAKYGGDESAPEPFQYFLASLATCAGIFALSFCQSRNISTEGLDLTVSYVWDEKARKVTGMGFDLTLPRGFPEKYHKAIVRAIQQCTVKKHLTDPPEFTVRIVD